MEQQTGSKLGKEYIKAVYCHPAYLTSLVAQRLKCLPAVQETWVRSLGREDPLEKEMATHSSILAWRIPWTEEPGRLHPQSHKELDTTERLLFTSLHEDYHVKCQAG